MYIVLIRLHVHEESRLNFAKSAEIYIVYMYIVVHEHAETRLNLAKYAENKKHCNYCWCLSACMYIYAPTSRWPQRYVCMYVGTYLVSLTHPFAHSSLSITPSRIGTFEKAKPDSQTYMLSVYIPPPPCSQGWKAPFIAMYSLIIIRSPSGFNNFILCTPPSINQS